MSRQYCKSLCGKHSVFQIQTDEMHWDVQPQRSPAGPFFFSMALISRNSVNCQRRSEMRFPDSGWPKEYDILSILEETHGGKRLNLTLVNGGLKTEVKVL